MRKISIRTRLFVLAAFALLLISPAIPVLAQSAGNGTINGTVTDTAGAVVPNTEVVIKDTDTGALRTLITNSDGYYTAPSLQSGHYEIVFGGGSYGKVNRKNLVLTVGQILTVDAAVPVGGANTEITVTDVAPILDSNKVEVSQTLSQEIVSNLPVNGRRYDNFVLLTTNVVPDGSSGLISYRGISGLYNSNLVDGTSNNQAFFSEARGRSINVPYVWSQDSIKEFASSASGYSAELGQAAGGQINAITKSGTNNLHGDLFYYLRYPSLNALDPFAKYTGRINNNPFLLTPTVHQQQQFGGSIGGPIIKDKLFGFFTYDGYRKVNPILYTSSIPASTIAAYATPGTATCPTASFQPGSTLTAAQCTAAANFIISNLTAVSRNLKQDIFFPRLDYQLNGKNHLSAQFNWNDYHQPNGYNSALTANNSSASQNGTANFHERILIANWETVVSANAVNAFHFQWARDLETDTANAPGPAVNLNGLFQYGMSLALPRGAFPDEHRWQAADVYTLSHGRHTMKFGVDTNFIHEQLANLFQGNGNYTYIGANAAANFGAWVQDVYGLNGARHYNQFTQVYDPITKIGADDFWNKNLAGFAEDAWKITPKLLISAGLRYDVQLVPQPPHPYTTSYNGVPSPLGNFYTRTININYKMLQPRLGFSFTPQTGTVIRGGAGTFYGLISNSIYYTTRVENGVYQQQYNILSPTASNAINAPNVLFTPPGPPLAAPFSGAAVPGVAVGGGLSPLSFRGLDPHFSNPYTYSFDLAVEQELPWHSTLTLAYVGTRGLRLPYDVDVNQNPPTTTRTYDIVNSAGATTSTVTVPFTPIGTPRPSPNDGNILVGFSGINSWYNSGAFSFKKPFNHGVEMLFNYTWSHAMDMSQVAGGSSTQNTGGGTFQGTNIILDPYNIKGHYTGNINMTGEYGRSDLDVRGRFVGSLVYSPVVEGSMPTFAKFALSGWTVSGTYTAQSGTPLVSLMSGTLGAPFASLDGGATGMAVTLNNAPGPGRVPFLHRNNSSYAGVHNADMRIARTFPIHDKLSFQVFGEVFNLANHKYIASVSGLAYQYVNPTSATGSCSNLVHSNVCIAPYTSTPFGAPTATSGVLYGARQFQFAGKLFF